jgi:NodT family efflux transporter outer membrane factor (OMF) lipoprotein
MSKSIRSSCLAPAALLLMLQGCSTTGKPDVEAAASLSGIDESLPTRFASTDTAAEQESSGGVSWRDFFADEKLRNLIDEALANNQEQRILLAEIEIARAEASARSGEYLPSATLRAGAGTEKPGEFTREGAVERQLELREDRAFPEPLPDYLLGIDVSWELDIWRGLRNAQKSAVLQYLATAEGRRFAQTHLVAEIAGSYYELVALARQASIIEEMVELQGSALAAVKLQKQAGEATELAVRRFEAELQGNRAELYQVRQDMIAVENRINLLAGRFPEAIDHEGATLSTEVLASISAGAPAALLARRPDIRRAELELAAAQLDTRVARARFYPSISLDAGFAFNAAEAGLLFETPQSIAYGIAADLAMPLLNRRGIRGAYDAATAEQEKALLSYQQTVLRAFSEVSTQYAKLENLRSSIDTKRQQARALAESVDIATRLYRSARADYTEVLLTQRDALEAQIELIDLEQQQIAAMVRMYELLGGGVEDDATQAPT